MDAQQEKILHLLAKFEKGEASEQEVQELDMWYQSFDNDAMYTNKLSEAQQDLAKKNLLARINIRLEREIAHKKNPFFSRRLVNLWSRIAMAAIVILCLSIGFYFLKHSSNTTQQVAQHDIAPGGNKAFLTLANGKKISLTDAKYGQVANQAGVKVVKTANGLLSYKESAYSSPSSFTGTSSYNKIETPNGGQYQVNLPDGTKVWLNAASSLKYPTSFGSLKERKVQLTGEAYFEVSHDRTHPFLVETVKETVLVLGTHFNVNSYNDEPAVKTTLLEGSVSVEAGSNRTIITPGEQANLTANKLKVVSVDTDDVIAWKNGMFQFSEESLESIMRKVSRWYDVDVEYANEEVKSIPLTGVITHFSNASKVLRMLELTQKVYFKIEGRKIIVISAKNSSGK